VWAFGQAIADRKGHRVVSLWVDEDTERGDLTTMADTLSMALAEVLRKADAEPDLDTLRERVRVMTQALSGARGREQPILDLCIEQRHPGVPECEVVQLAR
jgi:hypothetical protein